jgi:RNA polymerase sigma-B factor
MSIAVSPATRASEPELLKRYCDSGDLAARRELVERFLPFARDLANRYSYTDEPIDDLFQVACIGLLKAIDRYEPERGARFTSYAAPTILGELKRHFRDKGWALHVPRNLQERALKAAREGERLAKELGRSPSVREIAKAVGCSSEELLEAYDAASSYDAASLDAPTARADTEGAPLVDLIGGEDSGYEAVADGQALATAWRELPPQEQQVLELRFVKNMTQREIGERIGFSQMHVSRLLRRGVNHLEEATA